MRGFLDKASMTVDNETVATCLDCGFAVGERPGSVVIEWDFYNGLNVDVAPFSVAACRYEIFTVAFGIAANGTEAKAGRNNLCAIFVYNTAHSVERAGIGVLSVVLPPIFDASASAGHYHFSGIDIKESFIGEFAFAPARDGDRPEGCPRPVGA